ncbi:hypothetical protein GCM10012278_90170 [Nonomuraea glycinis]|uniref:Uncharacterized protein n=1 Tax=Nonomuraea glycinis TaxID=2047744 RepID=A0A918EB13_9ACTN|nr:hypothetical protein GCM10012278_90170 [Nonomuraea glycinis]
MITAAAIAASRLRPAVPKGRNVIAAPGGCGGGRARERSLTNVNTSVNALSTIRTALSIVE